MTKKTLMNLFKKLSLIQKAEICALLLR